MSKYLVIVESPTKAKTLKKFLGTDYVVESSIGHIRDLPAGAGEVPASHKEFKWASLGVDVEEDFAPLYVVHPDKKKKISELKKLLKDVDELLLATDEDREGEAISWHLVEVLKPKVPTKRMVFHEITKPAILAALEDTREIDEHLVNAQETRRIIDRLFGYEVSPILWRKIMTGLSAGRVQSVAVRILVHRERARMRFKMAQYWDLVATFKTPDGGEFQATLVTLDGKRLAGGKDFDPDTGKLKRDDVELLEAAGAEALLATMKTASFSVASAEEKPFTRTPAPPFTTSTLQQEGNRKLRFDAKRTMRAAQRLYENGYITYMRTDSVVLSKLALELTRAEIESSYGADYLPDEPRTYKNNVANAQEAHEAIRPAGDEITPVEEIAKKLGADESKIYDLIWKRTIASQMKDARGRRMTLRVGSQGTEREAIFQAGGSVIDFPGFLRAYVEGADDPEQALADRETLLPPVEEGQALEPGELSAEEHRTSPPARLTEATLVKALEESGIGRPSTYASIIDTIQRRNYTFKKGTALVPSFTAFAVVNLMEEYLTHLIDPEFTARMEDRLDAISRGEQERLAYLEEFYNGNGTVGLKPLLEARVAEIDPRHVCSIPLGEDEEAGAPIVVRVGKYGPFVERGEDRATVPDQTCPDELTIEAARALLEARQRGEEPIGVHPEGGAPIYLKTGRFGPYLQLGEADPDNPENKPKSSSLLRGMSAEDVTLEVAVQLLSLPRMVGKDAEGLDIQAFNGRYGPYIKRGDDTRSLTPEDDLLTLSLERALELLAQEKKGRGRPAPAKDLRVFTAEQVPELDGGELKVKDGRYGPYVTDGTVNASLPKEIDDVEKLTVVQALELIERARVRKGKKKAKKKKAKKKATKKKAAKKKATKKKATKKKAAKKKATKKASGEKAGEEGA